MCRGSRVTWRMVSSWRHVTITGPGSSRCSAPCGPIRGEYCGQLTNQRPVSPEEALHPLYARRAGPGLPVPVLVPLHVLPEDVPGPQRGDQVIKLRLLRTPATSILLNIYFVLHPTLNKRLYGGWRQSYEKEKLQTSKEPISCVWGEVCCTVVWCAMVWLMFVYFLAVCLIEFWSRKTPNDQTIDC